MGGRDITCNITVVRHRPDLHYILWETCTFRHAQFPRMTQTMSQVCRFHILIFISIPCNHKIIIYQTEIRHSDQSLSSQNFEQTIERSHLYWRHQWLIQSNIDHESIALLLRHHTTSSVTHSVPYWVALSNKRYSESSLHWRPSSSSLFIDVLRP